MELSKKKLQAVFLFLNCLNVKKNSICILALISSPMLSHTNIMDFMFSLLGPDQNLNMCWKRSS